MTARHDRLTMLRPRGFPYCGARSRPLRSPLLRPVSRAALGEAGALALLLLALLLALAA